MYDSIENGTSFGCALACQLRGAINAVRESYEWEQRLAQDDALAKFLHAEQPCPYEDPDAFAVLAKSHGIELQEVTQLMRSTRSKAGAAETLHQLPMEPPRQAADTPSRPDEPKPMDDDGCPTTRAASAAADLYIAAVESIDSFTRGDLLKLGAELSSEQLAVLLAGHGRAHRLSCAAHDVRNGGQLHSVR